MHKLILYICPIYILHQKYLYFLTNFIFLKIKPTKTLTQIWLFCPKKTSHIWFGTFLFYTVSWTNNSPNGPKKSETVLSLIPNPLPTGFLSTMAWGDMSGLTLSSLESRTVPIRQITWKAGFVTQSAFKVHNWSLGFFLCEKKFFWTSFSRVWSFSIWKVQKKQHQEWHHKCCILSLPFLVFVTFCRMRNRKIQVTNGTYLATRPVGVLPFDISLVSFYQTDERLCNPECENNYVSYSQDFWRYKFDLFKHFRSHITLSNVYLSSETLKYKNLDTPCNWNFIQIISVFNTTAKQILKFCGIHPLISYFSASNRVEIQLQIKPKETVQMDMNFSVIDRNRIESRLEWTETYSFSTPQLGFALLQCGIKLDILHIQVAHYRQVYMRHNSKRTSKYPSVTIFDGPGEKSEVIITTGKPRNVLLSTFQAVVHHYGFLNFSHCSTNTSIHYSSKLGNITLKMEQDNEPLNFSLPQSDLCLSTFCIFHLRNKRGRSLNITLSALTYTQGTVSQSCMYAGVAVYQAQNQTFTHLKTECVKTHLGKTYSRSVFRHEVSSLKHECRKFVFFQHFQNRLFKYTTPQPVDNISYYSETGSVLLVFYSFDEYGKFSAGLSISSTTCRTIIIRSCKRSLSPSVKNLQKFSCQIFQIHRSYWSRKTEDVNCHMSFTFHQKAPQKKFISLYGTGSFKGECFILGIWVCFWGTSAPQWDRMRLRHKFLCPIGRWEESVPLKFCLKYQPFAPRQAEWPCWNCFPAPILWVSCAYLRSSPLETKKPVWN